MGRGGHRYLVVHPLLHTSGFGNQVGMLLQHLALAAESRRALVLPPFHQPASHRRASQRAEQLLHADEVFNLTAASTLTAPVIALRDFRATAKVPPGERSR